MAGELGQWRRAVGAPVPPLIFSPAAIRDMQRFRNFPRPKNAPRNVDAARRAGEAIRQA